MMPLPFPDEAPRTNHHQRQPDRDTALRRQVTDGLRQYPDAGLRAITVHTQCGVVLLEGNVTRPAVRDIAARIARQINGVRDVCNMVTVSGSPGGAPSTACAGPDGQPDRTAFDDIVAGLVAQDPGLARPVNTSPALAVRIALAVVAGVTWAMLSVLLVTTTWLAVLIIGAAGAIAIAVTRRRRKPPRAGGTPRRTQAESGS
jgi:hypothetical protein